MLPHTVLGISMVYNLRIAQLTKQPVYTESDHRNHSLIGLPFNLQYKKYEGPIQNYAGGLASYIYALTHLYVRIDGAAAHIHAKNNHVTWYSGSATDDILLSAGYNFHVDPGRSVLTLSALTGIPTHEIDILKHPDFGYGQASVGLQLDGSYAIDRVSNVLYATRYVYFIPRSAKDIFGKKYTFSVGQINDILLAFKSNWEHHGYEAGYTARFNHSASCKPLFDDIVDRTNYIRSNFYAVYKYKFIVNDIANRILLDISYGFDHVPKKYGNKYILTTWGSWQVNF